MGNPPLGPRGRGWLMSAVFDAETAQDIAARFTKAAGAPVDSPGKKVTMSPEEAEFWRQFGNNYQESE